MAVPFPSPTFPSGYTPYPLANFVAPSLHYTAQRYFCQTPAPTNIFYWDPVSLVAHTATVTSNDQKTQLVINSEGKSITFNLAGDQTASVPVGLLVSP